MERRELVPDIGRGWVESRLGSEVQGELSAHRARFDGHHPFVASVDQRGDGGKPDWSAAEHRNAVAVLHVGLVDRMHAHRQRLGEGGDIQGNLVGNAVEAPVRMGDEHQRGECPLRGTASDPRKVPGSRLGDDPVAGPEAHDLGADPLDGARHLMAEAERLWSWARDPTLTDVGQVGPADATGAHPDEGISRTGLGVGDVVDPDVARPMDANLAHWFSFVSLRGSRRRRRACDR